MSTRLCGDDLFDLLLGLTPTFDGWDTDPTDAENIVDGNPDTICTTGAKTQGAAYDGGYIIWDFGDTYNIALGGFGKVVASAGTRSVRPYYYYDGAWCNPSNDLLLTSGSTNKPFVTSSGYASKLKIRIASNAGAGTTVAPGIVKMTALRLPL